MKTEPVNDPEKSFSELFYEGKHRKVKGPKSAFGASSLLILGIGMMTLGFTFLIMVLSSII